MAAPKLLKEQRAWHLYILECEGGSFYTGISPDPQKRFEAHSSGKGARYTKMHKPLRILVTEFVGSYALALRREFQVKLLHKPGKLKYIENPAELAMPSLTDRWRKRPAKKVRVARKRRNSRRPSKLISKTATKNP
jgi:putative endonuclease